MYRRYTEYNLITNRIVTWILIKMLICGRRMKINITTLKFENFPPGL